MKKRNSKDNRVTLFGLLAIVFQIVIIFKQKNAHLVNKNKNQR
jgi:hypothetical protein